MSSRDVFPARNLGVAEDWGRKVETRVRTAESEVETLRNLVSQLSTQVNNLAGQTLPKVSRVPEQFFKSNIVREVGVSQDLNWIPLLEQSFEFPLGSAQLVVNATGTAQLVGTSQDNDAPWVRVTWTSEGLSNPYTWYIPDSQGVRAASNSGAVFLATVGGAVSLDIPSDERVTLTVKLEVWSSSATNFATPATSNLAALYTQVTSYRERVLENPPLGLG